MWLSTATVGDGLGDFGSGSYGGITLTSLQADIAAYPAGISMDGFGLGGFGLGGFGAAASTYTWTSDPLTTGPSTDAVVPYDSAGNLGELGRDVGRDFRPAANAGPLCRRAHEA